MTEIYNEVFSERVPNEEKRNRLERIADEVQDLRYVMGLEPVLTLYSFMDEDGEPVSDPSVGLGFIGTCYVRSWRRAAGKTLRALSAEHQERYFCANKNLAYDIAGANQWAVMEHSFRLDHSEQVKDYREEK